MMRATLVPVVALAAVLLAGCTPGDEDPAAQTPSLPSAAAETMTPPATDEGATPDIAPTPDSASYPDVDDLRKAAVAAGLSCEDQQDLEAKAPALSAMRCGDLTLTVYATGAERDTVVNAALGDADSTRMFLVGANWLIEAADGNSGSTLLDLQPALGGFVVPQGS
jgi:hypothetical protein